MRRILATLSLLAVSGMATYVFYENPR